MRLTASKVAVLFGLLSLVACSGSGTVATIEDGTGNTDALDVADSVSHNADSSDSSGNPDSGLVDSEDAGRSDSALTDADQSVVDPGDAKDVADAKMADSDGHLPQQDGWADLNQDSLDSQSPDSTADSGQLDIADSIHEDSADGETLPDVVPDVVEDVSADLWDVQPDVEDPPPYDPPVLGNIPCLDYDGISDSGGNDKFVIPVATYAYQMNWLAEHGYDVLTFAQFLDYVHATDFPASFPKRPVLLFSDVSSRSFIDNAVPILQGLDFQATVAVENKLVFGAYDWTMTVVDLLWLQALGFEIASHSVNHPHLDEVDSETLWLEVGVAKADLEAVGLNIRNFVYPYGSYDSMVIQAVETAGYEAARATGGKDLRKGGYASWAPASRFEVRCAVMTTDVTQEHWEHFITNTHLEAEDIAIVINEAGDKSIISKGNFDQDSYGHIYMPDEGDEVAIPILVFHSGLYDVVLQVKTGVAGSPFMTSEGYHYSLNGEQVAFTEEGPPTDENVNVVWGFHRISGVNLTQGANYLNIRSTHDWHVLVDYLVVEPL